jgi:hypothetical protein
MLARRLWLRPLALALLLTFTCMLSSLGLASEPVSPCRGLLGALTAKRETPRQHVQSGLLLWSGAGARSFDPLAQPHARHPVLSLNDSITPPA